MTITVNIHKAKTNLSELIQRVESGEEIIIARDGVPVAKLVRHILNPRKRPPAGIDAGKVTILHGFDDPIEDFDLE